jgi:hypothetical protein
MTMVVIVIVEIAFAGDVLIPVIAAPLALLLTRVLLHPVMPPVTDILEGTVWRPHPASRVLKRFAGGPGCSCGYSLRTGPRLTTFAAAIVWPLWHVPFVIFCI